MWHVLFAAVLLAPPLSFTRALELAGDVPALQALERSEAARAELRRDISALSFNPVLQVQPGYRDLKQGGSGGELYLTVLQRLSIAGLADKRRSAVDADIELDRAAYQLVQRQVRRDVASAWLAQWAAARLQRLAESERTIAAQLAERLELARPGGEVTRVELYQATGFLAEADLFALDMEGRVFETQVALMRALARSSEPRASVAEELPSIDVDALMHAAARAALTPEERYAKRVEQAEHARLAEVTARNKPTMAIGAMAWREGGGDRAAVLTLEAELPFFQRGEHERATQAAQVALARGKRTDAEDAANAARQLILHELHHSAQQLTLVSARLVAAARAVVDAQQARLAAGEATIDEWVRARRALREALASEIEAEARHTLARFVARELLAEPAARSTP